MLKCLKVVGFAGGACVPEWLFLQLVQVEPVPPGVADAPGGVGCGGDWKGRMLLTGCCGCDGWGSVRDVPQGLGPRQQGYPGLSSSHSSLSPIWCLTVSSNISKSWKDSWKRKGLLWFRFHKHHSERKSLTMPLKESWDLERNGDDSSR